MFNGEITAGWTQLPPAAHTPLVTKRLHDANAGTLPPITQTDVSFKAGTPFPWYMHL